MKILESNLIKFNEKLYIKRAELIKRNKEYVSNKIKVFNKKNVKGYIMIC